ncbi:MAG: HlyD family efflux transporter periplasmic adaptor subunit [Crocinitomicaceae bacterium]|nr:HlyD family efflux transporter periplasmic adaptor subunit [Crocinitomicaceae bacterium]
MAVDKEKIGRIDERSHYFRQVLEKVPTKIVRWGNAVFFLIFVIILIGLQLIAYPDIVSTEMKITGENPPIEVHSLSQGRISMLFQEDNDLVEKGDWIILLQNSAQFDDVSRVDAVLNNLSTLDFWTVIDSVNLAPHLSLGEMSGPYLRLVSSIGEFQLFTDLRPQFQQMKINKSRNGNLSEMIRVMEKQQSLLNEEIKIQTKDLERTKLLQANGAVSALELEQKQVEMLAKRSTLEELDATILRTRLQQNGVNQENSALSSEQSERFFQLRNEILSSFNELFEQFEIWKKKYVITAPISGKLNLFTIRNQEQFVTSGQNVFTVTPTKKQTYFALLKMPLEKSGKVVVGQEVLMKLSNFPYTEYGSLFGKIETISEVPQEGFYSVKVLLPNQLTTSREIQLENKRELIGQAEIITEKRTLLNRIFNIIKN